jgi:hypothetical protein
MSNRIRWGHDEPGDGITLDGSTGSVGTLDSAVFHIWKAPQYGGELVLTSDLPGQEGRRSFGSYPAELKATAERWLSEFISSLGAVFPDSPAASPGWTLRVHMQREPGSDRAACSNDPRFRAVTGDPSKVTCAACLQRHVASVNDALRALETGQ